MPYQFYFPIITNQRQCCILPDQATPARTISASQAMASITGVSAVSSKRSFSSDTQGPAGRSLQYIAGVPDSPQKNAGTNTGVVAGLGKMVGLGGWVGKKWGVAPTKSVADLRSHAGTPSRPVLSAVQAYSTETHTTINLVWLWRWKRDWKPLKNPWHQPKGWSTRLPGPQASRRIPGTGATQDCG